MLNVNKKSHVLGHMMVLWIFGAPKSCSFKESQKGAQLTQLHELSGVEERSREKSCEVQEFLFD